MQTRYRLYRSSAVAFSLYSLSICRASTGETLFPMVELVDLVGCFQGVKGHHLYSPPHRDNLLVMRSLISPVQISIHLDSREQRRILSLKHNRGHSLPDILHRLRWHPLNPSKQPRVIDAIRNLLPTQLIPQVRARCLSMATRLIRQTIHHQQLHHLRLYPL
jgi:hypothetical protein